MSALPVDPAPGPHWDELVRFWEESDWPEGSKVEIIDGIIVVTPPPSGNHNDIADEVQRALYPVIRRDWGVYQTQPLVIPTRVGMFIPDVLVAPKKSVREAEHGLLAADAELVVEITSRSNANHDRVVKLQGYATAGVPLYLLIDRWHSGRPTATLYGEPKNGLYRVLDVVEFGEEIHLPAPFDLTIDTSVFPFG
ncbi:Uma2 family endonuclease [Streptomyces sp. SKN60]|uniref:Uma2 family endonuclease n=1 Tax=Streptomyces sp. SKN60 TaxID=2855506 RepID=UPI0022486BF2|nr:Uma2 family endonuclease [Streptomyces sp. SKN60]MCX2185627.1 Uma2 family endonuclease [Streptomyces sp. SKN60]